MSTESGERVKCLFNPKEYTFAKQNNWKDQQTGKNVPQIEFGGGQPATLQMELFFDTYAQFKSTGTPKDVRKEYTDKIWKLMIVDPKLTDAKNQKGRPPKVIFSWGQTWLFKAVITSITATTIHRLVVSTSAKPRQNRSIRCPSLRCSVSGVRSATLRDRSGRRGSCRAAVGGMTPAGGPR